MKFFTMDWWRGIQSLDFRDPTPEFNKHLTAIRDLLPADLLALQESISLHDANLRLSEFDASTSELRLDLDADTGFGGLRQLKLQYSGVETFRIFSDAEPGLPGPFGLGDLGYQEPDVTSDGKLVHRMLFSSGVEFEVVFLQFELEYRDVTD